MSVAVWGLLRAILLAGGVIVPHPWVSVALLGFVVAVCRLDHRSLGVDTYLANLGVSRSAIYAAALAPAGLLEVGLAIGGRLAGWG